MTTVKTVTATPLEPTLTDFDLRVWRALPAWDIEELRRNPDANPWLTAWQVGELVGEYDVNYIRGVLEALHRFGYATGLNWGKKRRWMRGPRKPGQ